jgi:hypothetical protein
MTNLDQILTIDDYFREFSHFHVRKATELLRPLHTPGRDLLPDFSDVTRKPFEPQAHVVAAAIKMLDQTRGMIIGECGVGKTAMGMLTIHKHAQRSVRKGGCNCNYRAIVLCPDNLIKKWKDEIEQTIPGAKVVLFDADGKGCKHLITDMNRLYEAVRGPKGRWRKPQGAEWYILGRDQAKYPPARSGLGNKRKGFGSVGGSLGHSQTVVKLGEAQDGTPLTTVKHEADHSKAALVNGSSRRFLVEITDQNGDKKRTVARRWVCPSCGKPRASGCTSPLPTTKSSVQAVTGLGTSARSVASSSSRSRTIRETCSVRSVKSPAFSFAHYLLPDSTGDGERRLCLHGGLIYQGPDSPANGLGPSLTVSLAPGTGWFCHTGAPVPPRFLLRPGRGAYRID